MNLGQGEDHKEDKLSNDQRIQVTFLCLSPMTLSYDYTFIASYRRACACAYASIIDHTTFDSNIPLEESNCFDSSEFILMPAL